MSRIKFSQNLSAARGSLGGAVLTYGNCGSVIRTKSSNTNKNSLPQNKQRVLFTVIVKLWNTLSDLQRFGWNIAAKSISNADALGNVTLLDGFDYFKLCNMNLSKCNRPIITDAPKLSNIFTFNSIDVTISYTANEINLNFLPVLPADTDMLVFATAPHGKGIGNVKNLFRFVMVLNSTYASPYNCINEYINTFGGIGTDGQKIVFRFIPMSIVSGVTGVSIDKIAYVSAVPFILGDNNEYLARSYSLDNYILLFPVTSVGSGKVLNYNVFVFVNFGFPGILSKCALYDTAFNLIANSQSVENVGTGVSGWHNYNIIGVKPIVSIGVSYWLAVWANHRYYRLRNQLDPLMAASRRKALVYTGVFPDPLIGSLAIDKMDCSFYGNCL